MNNNDYIISLKDVTKTFYIEKKKLNVLKNISINIKKASYTAIIGPSGAGKSTLLYIIGLLIKNDSGSLFLNGENVSKINEKKKSYIRNHNIGFIFQNYHLLPEFNAIENIMLPSLYKGDSKKNAYEKALLLLKKVGLENRALHKPSELSGGEQQRISICRCLINNPKIILADEPTGNLDTYNQNIIFDILQSECLEQKITLVMVTHNETLSNKANEIIHLLDGMVK